MGRVLAVAWVVMFAACGRAGFGSLAGTDGAEADRPDDAPPTSIPRSCATLASTCGPSGTGSCCESPAMPGGTYARSFDVASDAMFPDPGFPATLSSFQLDRYEVTVARFRAFVTAGQGTQASPPLAGSGAHPTGVGGWQSTWDASLVTSTTALVVAVSCGGSQTWTDTPGANENKPITCVTWYEAAAFCAWDGGYLPSEAEWNYAASGGDEQRAYPWSSPPSVLAIDDTHASWNCTGDGVLGCTPADVVDVGTNAAGDGRWGQSDLAGNVWEWTLDWKRTPYATPCIDCAELDSTLSVMVVRGGSWGDADYNMRAAHRGSVRPPAVREGSGGFRCARS